MNLLMSHERKPMFHGAPTIFFSSEICGFHIRIPCHGGRCHSPSDRSDGVDLRRMVMGVVRCNIYIYMSSKKINWSNQIIILTNISKRKFNKIMFNHIRIKMDWITLFQGTLFFWGGSKISNTPKCLDEHLNTWWFHGCNHDTFGFDPYPSRLL